MHNMNRKQNNAKCESASARPLVLELSAVANHAFGREFVSLKSNSEQRGSPSWSLPEFLPLTAHVQSAHPLDRICEECHNFDPLCSSTLAARPHRLLLQAKLPGRAVPLGAVALESPGPPGAPAQLGGRRSGRDQTPRLSGRPYLWKVQYTNKIPRALHLLCQVHYCTGWRCRIARVA